MESSFFGVIPKEIRHHKDLKPNDKLLFAEIMACLEGDGVCTKKNIYFSKALNLSKVTISKSITSLRRLGYLRHVEEYEKGTLRLLKRYLTPCLNFNGVVENNENTHSREFNGVDAVSSNIEQLSLDAPLNNSQTLSKDNTTIKKVYKDVANYPKNENITSSQLKFLKHLINKAYTRQAEQFPELLKNWNNDSKLKAKSINTLYDLITTDNMDHQVVYSVIVWAIHHEFWSRNCVRLDTLRSKSKNGLSRFQNMYLEYKRGL